jgi:hypothetical protein
MEGFGMGQYVLWHRCIIVSNISEYSISSFGFQ